MIKPLRRTAAALLVLLTQLNGCATREQPMWGEFTEPGPFQLSVEAAGSFKPGEPIHLSLHAISTYASSQGEVRLTLVELAAAEDCQWADEIRIATEEMIRAHLHVRKPLVPGEVLHESITLVIPEAGYYTLLAIGHRPTEPPMVPNVSSREYGVLITDQGGRLTEGFDKGLIPPGMRVYPGPFTPDSLPPRIRIVNRGEGCTARPPFDPAQLHDHLRPAAATWATKAGSLVVPRWETAFMQANGCVCGIVASASAGGSGQEPGDSRHGCMMLVRSCFVETQNALISRPKRSGGNPL